MEFLETAKYNWMDILSFSEVPFRAKLTPSKVWKDLDRYRNDAKGLSNYFKKWRTKIVFKQNCQRGKIYKVYVAIGGEYSPDDRQIEIHIYTTEFNTFHFTSDSWDKFKYRLIQTLQHELIHFMQYDRRGDEWSNYVVPYKKVGHARKDSERRYLSEFDEIQAYAHCIFLDLKTTKPNRAISDMLHEAKTGTCHSKTLKYFLKTFNYDYRNNQAIPKVLQQVLKWEKKYAKLNSK